MLLVDERPPAPDRPRDRAGQTEPELLIESLRPVVVGEDAELDDLEARPCPGERCPHEGATDPLPTVAVLDQDPEEADVTVLRFRRASDPPDTALAYHPPGNLSNDADRVPLEDPAVERGEPVDLVGQGRFLPEQRDPVRLAAVALVVEVPVATNEVREVVPTKVTDADGSWSTTSAGGPASGRRARHFPSGPRLASSSPLPNMRSTSAEGRALSDTVGPGDRGAGGRRGNGSRPSPQERPTASRTARAVFPVRSARWA